MPIRARSTIGQCAGLRIRAVEVRVLPCAPIHQGVGEPGRPCLPWKQKTGGSNPPALTILPVSSVGRAPLSEADVRGSSPRRAANRPDARVVRERSAKAPTPPPVSLLHAPLVGRAIAYGSDHRAARHGATSLLVIPAERAGFRPASESRNPVIKPVRTFTPAVDYWVPARASPVEPGSLGRDDSPYVLGQVSALTNRVDI
jgi:hypothetical protein